MNTTDAIENLNKQSISYAEEIITTIQSLKTTDKDMLRFLSSISLEKSHLETKCWIWTGSKRGKHGCMKYKGKTIDVHRLSYKLFKMKYGEHFDMSNHNVIRICKNTLCCNPLHLTLQQRS